jgi:hypothetical protein
VASTVAARISVVRGPAEASIGRRSENRNRFFIAALVMSATALALV